MKYGTWLNDWINTYKKPYIKSYDKIRLNVRLHIPESIKKTEIERLTGLEIQKALNAVKHSRTRLDIYNIYHGSLTLAYKLGFIQKNVAELLIKPKHQRQVGSALTKEELNDFLQAIQKTRYKYFYTFCLYTGCRRSEALSLKWEDVNFSAKTIHIHGTKTATSDKVIPLFPDCEKLLQSLPKKDKKIFHHYPNRVTRDFKKYCPTHKLHDLRHTFATRCLECGINIKVVQKWLGHSRLDTTASIYTHVQEDFVQREAEKFSLFSS